MHPESKLGGVSRFFSSRGGQGARHKHTRGASPTRRLKPFEERGDAALAMQRRRSASQRDKTERRFPCLLIVAFLLLAAAIGCTDESKNTASHSDESKNAESTDGGASESVPTEPIARSRQPRVKYKSGARYASDLAVALDLERDTVCRELGQYDCVDEVHRIVLGGVEPYTVGVRDPLPSIAVTAPIAQDRIALAACTERLARDLAAPEPLFLRKIDVEDPTPKQLETTAKRFYDRILRRAATADEVNALTQFHATVSGEAEDGTAATRDWATLSCFMVATTLESIFY